MLSGIHARELLFFTRNGNTYQYRQWQSQGRSLHTVRDGEENAIIYKIQCFSETGELDKVLGFLACNHHAGTKISNAVYVSLLRECGRHKALGQVRQVQAFLTSRPEGISGLLGDHLVVALAKCGDIQGASTLFFGLSYRTVFSWTAMISGYAEFGQGHKALQMLHLMQEDGLVPDQYTIVSLLKACANMVSLIGGEEIYAYAVRQGTTSNVYICNALVTMYGMCGSIIEAEHVFLRNLDRDIASWHALLSAYVEQQHGKKALLLYRQIHDEGVCICPQTIVITFEACTLLLNEVPYMSSKEDNPKETFSLEIGRALHKEACREGFFSDAFVGSALVSMYGAHGCISEAEHAFDRLLRYDAVCWNTMLSVCVEVGEGRKALHYYCCMLAEGYSPNEQTYVMALQACALLRDCETKLVISSIGRVFHGDAKSSGFTSNVFIVSALISFYSKCGSILDAEIVFNALMGPNMVCWTAMLCAYLEHGRGQLALQLYRQMHEECVTCDDLTDVVILQACQMLLGEGTLIKSMCMDIGQAVHANAHQKKLGLNVHVGNALVVLYSKLGSITEAEHVFSVLDFCDNALWDSMLLAYVEHGHNEKALQLFRQMQEEGMVPNPQTFIAALQAYDGLLKGTDDDLFEDEEIYIPARILEALHFDACGKGLACDSYVGSTFVTLYGKLGSILEAENIFQTLCKQNVVSWNALISAYVKRGEGDNALLLYRQMQEYGVLPDAQTFVGALQACCCLVGKDGSIVSDGMPIKGMLAAIGRALHADAWKRGLTSGAFLDNTLVSMYGKCGSIVEAENVFDRPCERNVVSWNALISAYAEQWQGIMALQLFWQMHEEGVNLVLPTYLIALRACADLSSETQITSVEQVLSNEMLLDIIRACHVDCSCRGFSCASLGCVLVTVYGKCDSIREAENAFDQSMLRNTRSWSAMMSAYVEHGEGHKALCFYAQMHKESCCPNQLTSAIALQAVGLLDMNADLITGLPVETVCLEIVKAIHNDVMQKTSTLDLFFVNSLIKLYGKYKYISEAENVFNCQSNRDAMCWLLMLSLYFENGQGETVLLLYRQMQEEGVQSTQQVFAIILQAITHLLAELEFIVEVKPRLYDIGKALHADAWREGFFSDVIGGTLVSFYGKYGMIIEAEDVFYALSDYNIVALNSLLSAYVEQGKEEKGLLLYRQMQTEVCLDDTTFTSVLQACSGTGNLEVCMQVHFNIIFAGYDVVAFVISNTLIRAYGNCASIQDAEAVFNDMLLLGEVSWNACIASSGQVGECGQSMELFEEMLAMGITATGITVVTLLSACGHAGHTKQAIKCFEFMTEVYGVTWSIKLFGAMIDLLGRMGDFKGVESMLLCMPLQASLPIWSSVLGSCYAHGNIQLGEQIFTYTLDLKSSNSALFVLMSNIHAEAADVKDYYEGSNLGNSMPMWMCAEMCFPQG